MPSHRAAEGTQIAIGVLIVDPVAQLWTARRRIRR
jgi:hypothetical protein